jgi:acyl carrier protein
VRNRCFDQNRLLSHLKNLVAGISRLDVLDPDRITDDEPLMGGSLCLDSLDALELAICVEEEFGIAICGGKESHRAFTSIANLAAFIHTGAQTRPARPLWAAKTNRWGEFRSATTVFPPAWRPVFASGAILTF